MRKTLDEKTKEEFNKALTEAFSVSHSYKDVVKNLPKEFARLLYLDAKNSREDIKSQELKYIALSYDPTRDYPHGYIEDQRNRVLSRVDRQCDAII